MIFSEIVRTTVALTLVFAFITKLAAFAQQPMQSLVNDSPWLTLSLFLVEFVLGIWLLSRHNSIELMKMATIIFSCFFFYSISKLVYSSEKTCDCFGQIQLPFWTTAIIDLAVVLCLMVSLRIEFFRKALYPRQPPYKLLCSCVCLVVFAWVSIYPFPNDVEILEKNSILGKKPVFISKLNEELELAQGVWYVYLLNSACGHCSSRLNEVASGQIEHDGSIAYVYVDEWTVDRLPLVHPAPGLKRLTISPTHACILRAPPLRLKLVDGVVVESTDQSDRK